MLLLELEAMLEGGLYALGVEFKPRQYGEDIRMGVSIDDALGEQTVEGSLLRREEGVAVFLMRQEKDLTAHQLAWQDDALDGNFPFFFRGSEIYNGLLLHYTVRTSEEMSYAEKADDIVKERKIIFEHLEILIPVPGLKEASTLVGFEQEPQTRGLEYSLDKCELRDYHKLTEFQVATFERLTKKEYSLIEVYHIAIDFLKA